MLIPGQRRIAAEAIKDTSLSRAGEKAIVVLVKIQLGDNRAVAVAVQSGACVGLCMIK